MSKTMRNNNTNFSFTLQKINFVIIMKYNFLFPYIIIDNKIKGNYYLEKS